MPKVNKNVKAIKGDKESVKPRRKCKKHKSDVSQKNCVFFKNKYQVCPVYIILFIGIFCFVAGICGYIYLLTFTKSNNPNNEEGETNLDRQFIMESKSLKYNESPVDNLAIVADRHLSNGEPILNDKYLSHDSSFASKERSSKIGMSKHYTMIENSNSNDTQEWQPGKILSSSCVLLGVLLLVYSLSCIAKEFYVEPIVQDVSALTVAKIASQSFEQKALENPIDMIDIIEMDRSMSVIEKESKKSKHILLKVLEKKGSNSKEKWENVMFDLPQDGDIWVNKDFKR
ncbi:unnamed protein product [Gordionus sp. m RMFG-2023]